MSKYIALKRLVNKGRIVERSETLDLTDQQAAALRGSVMLIYEHPGVSTPIPNVPGSIPPIDLDQNIAAAKEFGELQRSIVDASDELKALEEASSQDDAAPDDQDTAPVDDPPAPTVGDPPASTATQLTTDTKPKSKK